MNSSFPVEDIQKLLRYLILNKEMLHTNFLINTYNGENEKSEEKISNFGN